MVESMPIINSKKIMASGIFFIVFASVASATIAIHDVPCAVIVAMWDALRGVAPALFTIMFLYGAARYAYSAEDPGGRKQGKNIIIQSIIGALIMGTLLVIISILRGMGTVTICPGMVGI
jgi:hypothetical protein